MVKNTPFELNHDRYEAWFDKHRNAYLSELLALRPFVPWEGKGIEIGVGSGQFAKPLGIQIGIDPSSAMLAHAFERGIEVIKAIAEHLPFTDGYFDFALVVTTICFVESPTAMLKEASRVLKPNGQLILGFIDKESIIGQDYLKHQNESVFYREANFISANEVAQFLLETGFSISSWAQTLSHPLNDINKIEPMQPGYGQDAFVIVSAANKA